MDELHEAAEEAGQALREAELREDITDAKVLETLEQYANGGIIDYVMPTEPLGERWVVGIIKEDGQPDILHLNGHEVRMFLVGTSIALTHVLRKLKAKGYGL